MGVYSYLLTTRTINIILGDRDESVNLIKFGHKESYPESPIIQARVAKAEKTWENRPKPKFVIQDGDLKAGGRQQLPAYFTETLLVMAGELTLKHGRTWVCRPYKTLVFETDQTTCVLYERIREFIETTGLQYQINGFVRSTHHRYTVYLHCITDQDQVLTKMMFPEASPLV